jgi:hypothetical protein
MVDFSPFCAPRVHSSPAVFDSKLVSKLAAADRHWWWLTPLLLAALLLPGLGSAGLLDPWEMDRAAVARKMAAAPTVLVVEPGAGHLLDQLSQSAAGKYALAHPFDHADATASNALQLAVSRLGRQVAHAVVVDLDGLTATADQKQVRTIAAQLATIEAQNRSTALILVSANRDPERLRWPLALGRAHELAETTRNTVLHGLFEPDSQEIVLAPLFLNTLELVPPDRVAVTLDARCPSPLAMPAFKQDAASVSAPWLDSVLAALAVKASGVNEFAVRLPAALLAILVGWALVFALRRLWRPRTGWLALVVYATLPMTWGLAHTLTLQATESAGLALLTLGLALGAQKAAKSWYVLLLLGLALLAGGAGMGGLATACVVTVGAVLATGQIRGALGLGALAALAATALLAALVYGGDPDSLLLRSFRLTSWPFGGGPDVVHRDFAWVIGQVGFGLYPWSAIVVLGAGKLLTDDEEGADRQRARAVLLIGLVASLVVNAVLIRKFGHFVAPAGPLAAVAAAVLLDALLAGTVAGRTVAIFAVLATLLLHREIGKGAEAVVRFVVFDPPFSGGGGNHPWPEELTMPRALRAIALLSVLAFALGAAKPAVTIRNAVQKLRTAKGASWALAVIGILWALDGIVSLGTKLDVMLKTLATTWNYPYDRVWVTILGIRPEIIAGAVLFFALILYAVFASVGPRALNRATSWPLRLAQPFASPVLSLSLAAVGAAAVLFGGVAKMAEVNHVGAGQALAVGVQSLAFILPLLILLKAAVLRLVVKSGSWLDPDRPDNMLQPLAAGLKRAPLLVFGLTALWAVAGLGIGAGQASGTWNWAYLLGMWLLAIATLLAVMGSAQLRPAGYGYPLAAIGVMVFATVMGPMGARYLDETLQAAIKGQETAALKEGVKYLAHVLLTAPDTGGFVVLALLVLVNRLAAQKPLAARLVGWALTASEKLEQPRFAALALVLAGTVFTAGYSWSLLPGLSVHYSQKHLLNRIAEAEGATKDPSGSPRTFTHGSAKSGGESNFYTASMPQIDDRQAVLALLADRNVAVRLADNQEGGLSGPLGLPGWSATVDANHDDKRDAPAWYGVAHKVEGTRVTVQGAKWQAGEWKDAQFTLGQPAPGASQPVVDNGADWLTLSTPATLTADDPVKGAFSLDKLTGVPGSSAFSALAPLQRFVVVPKDAFSEINHAFREAYGRHIQVVDAASSRLVLLANHLLKDQADQNWIKKSLLTQAEFDALPGVKKVFANFDNSIQLVGFKMAEYSVQRSGKYKMTLYWKVVKPTTTSWKLFMHPHPLNLDRWPLTDPDPSEDENKPCGGCFATNHWMQGDIIADSFEQEVALGTQSGPNDIILGWYNPSSETRMTLVSASGQGVIKHGDNRVTIGQIQVR